MRIITVTVIILLSSYLTFAQKNFDKIGIKIGSRDRGIESGSPDASYGVGIAPEGFLLSDPNQKVQPKEVLYLNFYGWKNGKITDNLNPDDFTIFLDNATLNPPPKDRVLALETTTKPLEFKSGAVVINRQPDPSNPNFKIQIISKTNQRLNASFSCPIGKITYKDIEVSYEENTEATSDRYRLMISYIDEEGNKHPTGRMQDFDIRGDISNVNKNEVRLSNRKVYKNHLAGVSITSRKYPELSTTIKLPVLYKAEIEIDASGSSGRHGQDGYNGKAGTCKTVGGPGGNATSGTDGGDAGSISLTVTFFEAEGKTLARLSSDSRVFDPERSKVTVRANGGPGGNGGAGGIGGVGGSCFQGGSWTPKGPGGNGGDGGSGGDGGRGGSVTIYVVGGSTFDARSLIKVENSGGKGGYGVSGAAGGMGNPTGASGRGGVPGNFGSSGPSPRFIKQ